MGDGGHERLQPLGCRLGCDDGKFFAAVAGRYIRAPGKAVQDFADEILLMRAGWILQRGSVSDLVESPADPFVTQFVTAQRTTVLSGVDS